MIDFQISDKNVLQLDLKRTAELILTLEISDRDNQVVIYQDGKRMRSHGFSVYDFDWCPQHIAFEIDGKMLELWFTPHPQERQDDGEFGQLMIAVGVTREQLDQMNAQLESIKQTLMEMQND